MLSMRAKLCIDFGKGIILELDKRNYNSKRAKAAVNDEGAKQETISRK
jgi:hypothetical protein